MVTDVSAPQLQEDPGFAADEVVVTDEIEETPEPAETEETDPVAELRSEIASLKEELAGYAPLRQLDPSKINPALGRIASLQSALDESKKSNPFADIDPRISASEEVLTGLTEALISSDLIDDQSKASLRAAATRLEQSRSERTRAQLRQELLDEVRGAQAPQAEAPGSEDSPWLQATVDVVDEARALGYDPQQIPAAVWQQAQATGRPGRAVRHVMKWVEEQIESADESGPETRVASRRRAAGSGAPPRSGANSLEQDRARLQTEGIPLTEEATRKRIAAELGLQL